MYTGLKLLGIPWSSYQEYPAATGCPDTQDTRLVHSQASRLPAEEMQQFSD